jgi:hypothetical protein
MSQLTTRRPRPLFEEWTEISYLDRCDFSDLARRGVRGIFIRPQLVLSPQRSAEFAEIIWILREASGAGLRVDWSGDLEGSTGRHLIHLDPPADATGKRRWPVARQPLLTARYGPGFVVVQDQRERATVEVITDAHEVAALIRYARPGLKDSSLRCPHIARLANAGYLLDTGQHYLSLPIRLKFAQSAHRYPAMPAVDLP